MYNAITSGSKIIGTIIADGDIRIDGIVEGEMQCAGKVVIGEKGLIKGTVSCQNAEIMGTLDGKIVARPWRCVRQEKSKARYRPRR